MRSEELHPKLPDSSHELDHHNSQIPFTCDGCFQIGIGSRVNCSVCDLNLHTQCAFATPHLRHPFSSKCLFELLPRPPGNSPRYCNACGLDIAGFVYHCSKCDYDLHPCCAALPRVIHAEDGLRLKLRRHASASCLKCGRKGKFWAYSCACKKINLHVACSKDIWLEDGSYGGGGGDDSLGGGRGGSGMAMESGKTIPITITTGNSHHHTWRANSIPITTTAGNIHRHSWNGKSTSITRTAANSHHHSWKRELNKCCKLVAIALHLVIAAVLGDPTAIIAGVVSSLSQ